MCGIAGLFDSRSERPFEPALLKRMTDAIRHRGPDGEGFHLAPGIALGHRRLAIIDLDQGRQPMFNEDGSVAVTYNGEIYNFQDLRAELEAAGHRFATRCDTEVIVHGWEEWGPSCVTRFRGMFAFALWDESEKILFLARDRLGIKPLHYAALGDGAVLFGSELKALLAHPGLAREIDPEAVADYFAYGYVPDPKCIYKGVAKLPAGATLVWRRGAPPRLETYWDLKMAAPRIADATEAADALVAHLRDAVQARLVSDVPLGAFLSGGVDSSGVVAMMAGLMAEPVNSFSIGFEERAFDESVYARDVATRYRTRHHSRRVDPDDCSLVPALVSIYDEPFGDSSAIPTYRICEAARRHVTVCLSGDGGDETFAGYRRYLFHAREAAVRGALPSGVGGPLFGLLGRVYPKLDWAPRALRARTTFQELAMAEDAAFFHSVAVTPDALRARLFSASFKRALGGYHPGAVVGAHLNAADTDDALLRAQYADIKTWLSGDILTKVDRASMAHSLEVRVPILDHHLVEWSAALAPGLKLRRGEGKYILKKALEPYLGRDLLYRRKQGFSVPLARWLRGPLKARVGEMVTGPWIGPSGFFDMDELAHLADAHLSGLSDHSAVLWLFLMFDSFLAAEGVSALEAAGM